MARENAITRLYERLLVQRAELRRLLGLELSGTAVDGHGDAAEAAMGDIACELNSQLAAIESRELVKIEKALQAIRAGRYGLCERCQKKIPVARLNVLPYAPHCVTCQKVVDERTASGDIDEPDWERMYAYQSRQQNSELTMSDIDIEKP